MYLRYSLRISVPRASYIVNTFTTFLAGLDMDKAIQIDFFETNALRAIQHVSGGYSDIGAIRCRTEYKNYFISLLEDSNLSYRPLLESDYLVLLSREHPLAEYEEIDEPDLHSFIEITHGDTAMSHIPGSFTEIERGTTPGNKKVQVYERGSQFDILARVPGAYMWVSPMPGDLLERNGLLQKRCCPSPRFSDFLVYSPKHKFSPQEEIFLSLLEKSVEVILSKKLA